MIAAVGAAIALGTSVPAEAAVFTYEWGGVLDGNTRLSGVFNTDDTGIFGMGEAAVLTGNRVTVSVRVDTATPGATILNNSDPWSTLYGFGSATPIGVSITINGISFSLDDDHIGGARLVTAEPPDIVMGDVYTGYDVYAEGGTAESPFALYPDGSISQAAIAQSYYRLANTVFYTPESAILATDAVNYRFNLSARQIPVELTDGNSLTAPPSGTWALSPDNAASGSFMIFDDHQGADGLFIRHLATASFLIDTLTIRSDVPPTVPTSVPEPATAGLMLAGLLVTAAGTRRRRAVRALNAPG